jgi:uncharacterized Zn-finger protein
MKHTKQLVPLHETWRKHAHVLDNFEEHFKECLNELHVEITQQNERLHTRQSLEQVEHSLERRSVDFAQLL